MLSRKNSMSIVPIRRSLLRIFFGKQLYRLIRYLLWLKKKNFYQLSTYKNKLPCSVIEHSSPLLRNLKNLEMIYQYNKIENLKLAVAKLNNLVLEPGQIFSFWRNVGFPSRLKGYKMGFTLSQGKIKPGIGGGLCQLSNLIYWMSLHTPLTVIERYRHSYDVFPDSSRSLPFGSGATVSYNYIDLQIENRTAQRFQLSLDVGPDHLFGRWLSDYPLENRYEIREEGHRIDYSFNGIYSRHNRLIQVITNKKGDIVAENLVAQNDALMMYSPLLGDGKEVSRNHKTDIT